MSIEPRAVMPKATRMGWSNYGNWGGQIWTQPATIGVTCPYLIIHVILMN